MYIGRYIPRDPSLEDILEGEFPRFENGGNLNELFYDDTFNLDRIGISSEGVFSDYFFKFSDSHLESLWWYMAIYEDRAFRKVNHLYGVENGYMWKMLGVKNSKGIYHFSLERVPSEFFWGRCVKENKKLLKKLRLEGRNDEWSVIKYFLPPRIIIDSSLKAIDLGKSKFRRSIF